MDSTPSTPARHRSPLAVVVVVLGSLLLGALAAGTPVAGNDSVAALTAGIELGTAPVARAVAHPAAGASEGPWVLAPLVSALLVLAARVIVFRRPRANRSTPGAISLLAGSRTWRGPPA